MPPRGPEEAWKSLRTCSPKERERVSPIARGPDSHKELPSHQVAVWLEPTPRVWKGAVLVIASASQSRQKYIKGSKVARINNKKHNSVFLKPHSILLKPDSI